MDTQPKDYYLNDIERDAIATFVGNPTMLEAVRKVLLAGAYFNGTLQEGIKAIPNYNFALMLVANREAAYTDEALGADLRAAYAGVRLIEQGFARLEEYKAEKSTPKDKRNPGR